MTTAGAFPHHPAFPSVASLREGVTSVMALPPAEVTLRVTVWLMLLHGSTGWVSRVVIAVVAGVMLLHPTLLRVRSLWIIMLAAMFYSGIRSWYAIDNHKYLMMYWVFACALAVGQPDTRRVLRANARLLIGLCFAFAVAWKIVGGEYLDGSFLHGTFLLDGRVRTAAALAGGMTAADVGLNPRLVSLAGAAGDGAAIDAVTSGRLHRMTLVASYWTLLIEGTVAVTFLASAVLTWVRVATRPWVAVLRDGSLLVFVLTTYFLLPVLPFAMLLCLLGLAQVEDGRERTRGLYLAAVLIVQLTMIPWSSYASSYGWV